MSTSPTSISGKFCILYLQRSRLYAIGEGLNYGKIEIKKGSLANSNWNNPDHHCPGYRRDYHMLQRDGILIRHNDDYLKFTRDYKFNSLSHAASVIRARNAYGHGEFKEIKFQDIQNLLDLNRNMLCETEIVCEVVRRKGQNSLREELIRQYGKCQITNISDKEMLIVSHIKPWRDCDKDEEKMDLDNCLLLYASWDKAFDRGKVTFDNNGQWRFSDCLSQECRDNLLYKSKFPIIIRPEQQKYMKYHREKVFLSQKT